MCQQQVFWVQQWCVNIEVVTEMWCGLCKGSWQSQRETRTFISASSVCLFCHLLSYSTLCTWRLWVKIKAAANVLTCISVKTINFSNYLCVLHTSESQHSTVVRACGELPACLSMEMCSAFLFCPVISFFTSVQWRFLHSILDTAENLYVCVFRGIFYCCSCDHRSYLITWNERVVC